MIAFAHPWMLVLLLPLAALALWQSAVEAGARARAMAYSSLPAVVPYARDVARVLFALRLLAYLGMALIVVALAAPNATVGVPLRDAAAIICIDTSGSMGADDFAPTRSVAASAAARRFIDAMPAGTSLGIVSFAGDAQVVLIPTRERDQQRAALERIPAPNGATAIGAALVTAASLLPKHGRRAIVLLTDGENNRPPDPQQTASQIGRRGIQIDTIGIGLSQTTALIPGTNELAGLDAPSLQAIATAAHGSYAQASNAGELAAAFTRVARAVSWERRREPLTGICIAAALAALMLSAFGQTAMLRG
ncbi:MAG: VWA domain-containing protein [bacterium]|nr:VWA domain-containing protein [bacterium]